MTSSRGFTFIELMITIGILMIVSSIVLTAIDPAKRAKQAWDANRIAAIHQLKNAIEAYETINKVPPNCDGEPSCPANFEITGTDLLSQELLDKKLLQTIPQRVGSNPSDLCNFQIYLYPSSAKQYYLRWCYESWTEDTVNRANLASSSFDCDWAPEEQLAYCATSSLLEIPQPNF